MLKRKPSSGWLMIALLWAVLLLLATWRPLALPDEGRYGEIGRWMLSSGDWLTPRLDGIPFFHKPPYLYWLEALSLDVFGVHAWAARLIPALHAGLMLVSLYLGTRHLASEPLARRATLMLGTSLGFLIGGQYINHDMLVAAWISTAIWCFAVSFFAKGKPRVSWSLAGFAACALGVLSKGLIGVALPGLVLLVWLGWTRQLGKILQLPWLRGLAIFSVLALPWFVWEGHRYPGMLDYMFGTHQFSRYTGGMFNNVRPWWYYLMCVVVLMFPWVLFIVPPRRAGLEASRPGWTALLWIWVMAIVVFFSIPQSKIIGYVLPVLPPLALLSAQGYDRWMKHKGLAGNGLLAGLALASIAVAAGVTVGAGRYSRQHGAADIAQTLRCQASPVDTIYALGDFPYDLPFYLGSKQPMVVIQDWADLRQHARDSWQRELFEGADFDAGAGLVLQNTEVLEKAVKRSDVWLLVPSSARPQDRPVGWAEVHAGRAWTVLRPQQATPSSLNQQCAAGTPEKR